MAERGPYSLAARLALMTAAWSALALLVTGIVLAELFRSEAERNFDARIEADLVNLVRDVVSRPPDEPPLPREPLGPLFHEPFSGWAWQVRREGQIVAQSGSLGPMIAGVMEPLRPPGAKPADFIAPGGIPSRGAERAILLSGQSVPLTFAVARPREEIDSSLTYFSRLLLYSLALFAAVMFAASLVLTRMMLTPVNRLKETVRRMREGEPTPFDIAWPKEIAPVISELDSLSNQIGLLVERSRNQTSDLAHALKTPLSVIRHASEQLPDATAEALSAEIDRIERSLDWHLTRHRLAGRPSQRVSVAEVAENVLFAMSRLFERRNIDLRSRIDTEIVFVGDEEDLHEMLGNLLDNACKWARGSVAVAASVVGEQLRIDVDDDGPGIPEEVAEAVFHRGARLDETAPGHGHGLAIVRDIARHYGGEVTAARSALGGASVRLALPGTIAPAGSAGGTRPE